MFDFFLFLCAFQESSGSSCLGMNYRLKTENRIEFSNVYAVELIDWGLIEDANRNSGSFFSGNKFEVRYQDLSSMHPLSLLLLIAA